MSSARPGVASPPLGAGSSEGATWFRRLFGRRNRENAARRLPSLEVHIPIGPSPSFFNMIRYFAATLRQAGGAFSETRLIVSVGHDGERFDVGAAYPELARYGIEWRWVDRESYRRHSFFATGLKRWETPFDADFVLMADADICITGDISDLTRRLMKPRSVAGVVASYPPFMARGAGNVDRDKWRELFSITGLGEPPWNCRHPGYGVIYSEHDGIAEAPPYFNFGFVLGTREAMNAIGETFEADYHRAVQHTKTDLAAQVGLTLSIVRNRIDYLALPVRYNFWSAEWYLSAFPEEAKEIRVLHYLTPPFQKHQDNQTHEDVGKWVAAHRNHETPIYAFMAHHLGRAHAAVAADALAG
jgi:hypothetical protein